MDVPGRLAPRADLRVGDADRQNVVAELQRHFIDGRLTSDELGERVAEALRARTFGELAVPLADLPVLSNLARVSSSDDIQPNSASHYEGFGLPVGALILLIGLVSMFWMFAVPGMHHLGGLGIWPIFIWAFFLIGRPPRGGRRDGSRRGGPPARYQ
jgi:hypothetical protein